MKDDPDYMGQVTYRANLPRKKVAKKKVAAEKKKTTTTAPKRPVKNKSRPEQAFKKLAKALPVDSMPTEHSLKDRIEQLQRHEEPAAWPSSGSIYFGRKLFRMKSILPGHDTQPFLAGWMVMNAFPVIIHEAIDKDKDAILKFCNRLPDLPASKTVNTLAANIDKTALAACKVIKEHVLLLQLVSAIQNRKGNWAYQTLFEQDRDLAEYRAHWGGRAAIRELREFLKDTSPFFNTYFAHHVEDPNNPKYSPFGREYTQVLGPMHGIQPFIVPISASARMDQPFKNTGNNGLVNCSRRYFNTHVIADKKHYKELEDSPDNLDQRSYYSIVEAPQIISSTTANIVLL